VRAVNAVDFEVRPGEIFGLLGPNGSGKSTILKMTLGLLAPSRGQLQVFGLSPRHVRTKARIGYLPEESTLYPFLTAEEILAFYAELFDLDRAERRRRIDQLLDMVGLGHARRRQVGEFSKGMLRRIGLAQALINDPDLVVLDEPTSGLDPVGCRQVKDLILALTRRGKTVLISSHLLADVEDICDRVAILCDGHIVVQGAIRELLERRESQRLVFSDLPAERLAKVLEVLRRETGLNPAVDHPARTLEEFFLEAVAQARRQAPQATGVAATDGLAEYLSRKDRHE
jgi:ABC-2 type transport system ATP-binding protein